MNKLLEALIARKGNSITGNYYLAKCENCEEIFTSERMTGGEPIADTGDYGDCYCPHCGTDDSEIIDCGAVGSEAVEAWNFQQKHIDALIAALEQSQRQNADLKRDELLSDELAAAAAKELRRVEGLYTESQKRITELEASQLAMKLPRVATPLDAAAAIRACMDEFPEAVQYIVEECAVIAENTIRAAGGTIQEGK